MSEPDVRFVRLVQLEFEVSEHCGHGEVKFCVTEAV